MAYILRARNRRTLVHNGREYRDGDRIVISKADAQRIALDSRSFRFEASDGDTVDMASIEAATAPPAADARRTTQPAS